MNKLLKVFHAILEASSSGLDHTEALHEIYREPAPEKTFQAYKKEVLPIIHGLQLMGFTVYMGSVELHNKTKFYIRVEWAELQPMNPIELCTPTEIYERVRREDKE